MIRSPMPLKEAEPIRELVVLVADASPTVRRIVYLILQRENIHVIAASDSLSALAAVADEDPNLILLDIRLPRMDSYDLCRVIRDKMRFRHIPIIMLGGQDERFDKDRGRFAGASDFLPKPFDVVELVQAVKKHLGSAPPR